MRWIRTARRADERGSEAVAVIFVLPFLFVLILGLIDVGMMLKTRMMVQSVAAQAARAAAFDGGDLNPRTNQTGRPWSAVAVDNLWVNGSCTQSGCTSAPTVDCTHITRPDGSVYRSQVVASPGDLITCTVTYNFKPINGALLNGPLGLGIGSFLHPFTVSATARSEVGASGQ